LKMKYTKEQITKAYQILSENDRGLFMAPETSEITWRIAQKFNLPEDQETTLVDLTTYVILKLDKEEDLAQNISTGLGVDTATSSRIQKDVVDLVLKKFESYGKTAKIGWVEIQQTPVESELITKTIDSIAQKQNLSEAQKIALKSEVGSILSKKSEVGNLRANLTQKLGVSYDQAIKISIDLSEIFKAENPADSAQPKQSEPAQTSTPTPTKLIPDHEEMTRADGPHLHSQNIMPSPGSKIRPSQPLQAKPVQPNPAFKSIVDEKLSGVVRSASSIFGYQNPVDQTKKETPKQTPNPTQTYRGQDPYREPIE